MSGDLERSYRRLLSSYPRQWRLKHEEVVLGTLLDEAEAEGWTRPRQGQRASLMAHGMAERISPQAIILLSLTALVFSLLGAGLLLAAPGLPTGGAWSVLFLGFGLPGFLVVSASCGLLRRIGWIGHVRSLVVPALAAPALVAAVLAAGSWSQGFHEADSDLPESVFSSLFVVFALSGLIFGTVSAAILLSGLFERTIGSVFGRRVASLLIGLGIAVFAGISLMSQGAVPLLALLVVAATVWAGNSPAKCSSQMDVSGRNSGQQALRNVARSVQFSSDTRILAGISAVLGLGAVAFALTGSQWAGVGMESTYSMRVGLMLGYLAGIPLAVGLSKPAGSKGAARSWPLVLILSAMLVSAAGNGLGDGSGDLASMLPLGVSASLASAAVGLAGSAWWKDKGNYHFGSFGPVIIGLGFFLVMGFAWATMAPFALPVLASFVALWTSKSKEAAPVPANG